MNTTTETLEEITAEAIDVLYREMGVAKTLRFLSQLNYGYGDYTKERERIFAGLTVADIVAEVKRRREETKKSDIEPDSEI